MLGIQLVASVRAVGARNRRAAPSTLVPILGAEFGSFPVLAVCGCQQHRESMRKVNSRVLSLSSAKYPVLNIVDDSHKCQKRGLTCLAGFSQEPCEIGICLYFTHRNGTPGNLADLCVNSGYYNTNIFVSTTMLKVS